MERVDVATIIKLCWFLKLFFVLSQSLEINWLHFYYETHCLWDRGWGFFFFWRGDVTYSVHCFSWSICCLLSIKKFNLTKTKGKLLFGDIELMCFFFFTEIYFFFLVHCIIVEISCMHVLCIINETVNIIKLFTPPPFQICMNKYFSNIILLHRV